jgi:hypothetical protein
MKPIKKVNKMPILRLDGMFNFLIWLTGIARMKKSVKTLNEPNTILVMPTS